MRFERSRDAHGRIRGGRYIVQEIAGSPDPDLPDVVKPSPVAPVPAIPGALPNRDVNLTTTTPTVTKERCSSGDFIDDRGLEFAPWVPLEIRSPALEKVARLNTAEAQIVIDEWAGIMATDRIESSPLGYLHAMVSRLEAGEFRLHYADEVADIRAQESEA